MAEFVKIYQTLIVGILGFIGVMATLMLNAWLARKAERRRIVHETMVLRTALIEEMKAQRDALLHAAEGSKKAKDTPGAVKQGALTPLQRWTDIFDSSLDKLGLLTSEEVAAVLDAYLPLKELTSKVRLLELRVPPDGRRVEYGEGPPEGYAVIGHQDVEVLAELHSIYVPAFDKAIQILSARKPPRTS
jgi:hypothetical protein